MNGLIEQAIKSGAEPKCNVACPICVRGGKHDRKKALYINRTDGYYRCFRCGIHGSFGDRAPSDIWLHDSGKIVTPSANEIPLPEEFVTYDWLQNCNDKSIQATKRLALDYAHKRAITRDIAEQYGIGFCIRGPKAGRIIVPITEGPYATKTYGYVARDYTGWSDYPYLYPKGMSRGITFFNSSALYEDTDTPLLVMEGVLDCLPHLPNAVAVLGMPSHTQLQQLTQCVRPVVFALDGDAWQQAEMLSWQLRFLGCTSGFIKLKPKQDPDEISKEALLQMAKDSMSMGV